MWSIFLTYHMQDTLMEDSSRTSPASICPESVVTERCSPGLTLTSEENSIAGSIACQMTSLERLTLVHLIIVIQEQFHQWLAGRKGRHGEDEKEKGTWFPISLGASLALPLRLKCFLSGEQRTLTAPGCFVTYLRPLWRVERVGQLRRVEPLSEFSNGWNIVKWRESYQD